MKLFSNSLVILDVSHLDIPGWKFSAGKNATYNSTKRWLYGTHFRVQEQLVEIIGFPADRYGQSKSPVVDVT
jgi:hypothetical protein